MERERLNDDQAVIDPKVTAFSKAAMGEKTYSTLFQEVESDLSSFIASTLYDEVDGDDLTVVATLGSALAASIVAMCESDEHTQADEELAAAVTERTLHFVLNLTKKYLEAAEEISNHQVYLAWAGCREEDPHKGFAASVFVLKDSKSGKVADRFLKRTIKDMEGASATSDLDNMPPAYNYIAIMQGVCRCGNQWTGERIHLHDRSLHASIGNVTEKYLAGLFDSGLVYSDDTGIDLSFHSEPRDQE